MAASAGPGDGWPPRWRAPLGSGDGRAAPPAPRRYRQPAPTALPLIMLRPGLAPRDVGRNALPAPVAPLPIVGVTAAALSPIGLLVAGGRVDDGEVAEDPDHDVVLAQVF